MKQSKFLKPFTQWSKPKFKLKSRFLEQIIGVSISRILLGAFLKGERIIHQSSCVDIPQQNGLTKRINKHLLEVARSLMVTTNVPKPCERKLFSLPHFSLIGCLLGS